MPLRVTHMLHVMRCVCFFEGILMRAPSTTWRRLSKAAKKRVGILCGRRASLNRDAIASSTQRTQTYVSRRPLSASRHIPLPFSLSQRPVAVHPAVCVDLLHATGAPATHPEGADQEERVRTSFEKQCCLFTYCRRETQPAAAPFSTLLRRWLTGGKKIEEQLLHAEEGEQTVVTSFVAAFCVSSPRLGVPFLAGDRHHL